jgi:hypothetical protein
MWFIVIAVLILLNEVSRRSIYVSIFLFLLLPIFLSIVIWPQSVDDYSEVDTWFNWVKLYSALVSSLYFLAIRFLKGLNSNKYAMMFPAIALAINIALAVIRDFQIYGLTGIGDGMRIAGGPWNIMNGIAGILNIITISGWMGIFISKNKYKDIIWPDLQWFWILAYSLWNFAFVYNCIPDHSFYSGAALLVASIVPAFFIKKGAWLQHRAQTLAIWTMFTMSYPAFVSDSKYAVNSSHLESALWIVSCISLAANMAVFVYHFNRIIKHKLNPLQEEVYSDLRAYKEIRKSN